jgi:hypothetical protein
MSFAELLIVKSHCQLANINILGLVQKFVHLMTLDFAMERI